MPELPEVETITNALRPHLMGRKITAIQCRTHKLRYELTLQQRKQLLDSEIIDVRRRARYSIIELANQDALIFHYGMTGAVRIVSPETELFKHEHVIFTLDNNKELRFEDPRKFGFIQEVTLKAPGDNPDELNHLGPEPFADEVTGKYLHNLFKGRKVPIKTALMNNSFVVGIGNIYANESLFMSGIHPQKPAGKVFLKKLDLLVQNFQKTLMKAIAEGGTTIADFKGVDGSEGKFAQHLYVYGREGEKCLKCDDTVIRIVQSGRSTFICPTCQKR